MCSSFTWRKYAYRARQTALHAQEPEVRGHLASIQQLRHLRQAQQQHGLSLIEVLVGIAIDLLTAATAMTTVLLVRSLSTTVAELAHMQQQAAYVFRVMGQQIRQAGGYALQPASSALEIAAWHDRPDLLSEQPVYGVEHPAASDYTLTVRLANSIESLYTNKAGVFEAKAMVRNCLNENPGIDKSVVLSSSFKQANKELVCAGSAKPQAMISDVADFQVRYLLALANGASPMFQYVAANAIQAHQWLEVVAVEICLELEGQVHVDTAGTTYIKCDGSTADRANRQRMVLRNHYAVRIHR